MGVGSTDVVIIGAGAYGLSLASHLRARGIDHRIFGPPMETWKNMSPGMYLKSQGFATNIYTPRRDMTLTGYCRARGLEEVEPIEIATFADYGIWVQGQVVPQVEPARVIALDGAGEHFIVTIEGGEQVRARRVVVAVGLTSFEHLPPVLAGLPAEMVSHTAHVSDFSHFAGMDVAVIGAGQSALQAAALLHEHAARPRLLARDGVLWGGKMASRRTIRERLRRPNSVLGPGRRPWVLEHLPTLMHYVPDERRLRFTRDHLGPLGAWWLRDRVDGRVDVRTGVSVVAAKATGGKLRLQTLDRDGHHGEEVTDHLVAGTGYRVDVDRIRFLAPALGVQIERVDGSPRLSRHFESSVRGLYFVGPASAASFGPLFRFVAGAAYAVPAVANHLARPSFLRALTPGRGVAPVARRTR